LQDIGSVEQPRRFVYVIQSLAKPDRHYVGLTADVAVRLRSHNEGQSPKTAKHRPWRLVVYAGFASAAHAERLAKDLKSASARGIVSRYFT
jgi:predicted GIY-YIG superfamily endonuclease